MASDSDFSRWLGQELRTRGLSQSQLAAYLGLNPSSVNRWFREGGLPSPKVAEAIAALWKMDPDDLLRLIGHKPPKMSEDRAEYAAWELDPRLVGLARSMAPRDLEMWLAIGETLIREASKDVESRP